MKQGWEIKKLGEVANILNGYAFDSKLFSEDSNDVPLIRIRDIKRGYTETFYKGDFSEEYIIRKGDYLIGMDGEFNIAEWKGENALLNQRVCKIITNKIVDRYLFWYMPIVLKQIEDATPFVTVKHLSSKQLINTTIPIPPREEQERIVEELDCLSGVIEKKREQLRELDALAQSIFYQMFGDPITNEKGWEVKKIKEVFSVKIGPFGSLLHNSDYISGGTPLVNPIHMHNERICPDFDFSVSDDKLKELRNYILRTNDIVLARRGDIGRCAIVGVNEDGYLCGTGSLFMRPTTGINSNFIIKQIRCNSMIEYLTSLAKGATMLNINCKIVEELNFILPPISLQQEFADKIEAIEKQKALIKQSIAETETLFNARMDYYFN